MGKSNTELLKIAQKYLGQGGSRFRKFCGLPAGAAWCNAFVDYIAAEGDDASLYFAGKKMTYCPTSMAWCQKNLAQIPIYIALPMDIIYFDWEPNGVPNHIGFVRERKSDLEVYTIEGNTSGGIVAQKTRPVKYVCGVFRPHFKGSFDANKALVIDSYIGYNSIACLQKALKTSGYYTGEIDAILGQGTVKALQKMAKASQIDGSWGPNTTKAVQRMTGAKVDGYFGPESAKKLQQWINKVNNVSDPKPATKPAETAKPKTKAQQINDTAVKFAWPKGTKESVYKYPSGKPDPDFIAAWKKYFPDRKINCGCHQFVMLVLKACGYPTMPLEWNKILAYLRKNFTEVKVNYTQSQLKPGDIRVHKNSKGGHHIWIIVEINGKLYRAEANQQGNKRYAHINTNTSGNVKKHAGDWLFRAK